MHAGDRRGVDGAAEHAGRDRPAAARLRFASVAFGGVALLATGDFLQLKPIANASLASALPSAGRELWVQHFKSVVLLRTNMRAAADPVYAALLERVRMGACTLDDVALLNTRVLSATNVLTTSVAERVVPRPTSRAPRSTAARSARLQCTNTRPRSGAFAAR